MATKKQEKAAPAVYVATKPFELTVTQPSGLKVTHEYVEGDEVELPSNYKPDPVMQDRLESRNAGLAFSVEYLITYIGQDRKEATDMTTRTVILPVRALVPEADA